jgi:hypothetical protein
MAGRARALEIEADTAIAVHAPVLRVNGAQLPVQTARPAIMRMGQRSWV